MLCITDVQKLSWNVFRVPLSYMLQNTSSLSANLYGEDSNSQGVENVPQTNKAPNDILGSRRRKMRLDPYL